MILPSKVIKFEESVIGRIANILDIVKEKDIKVSELYEDLADKFEDINQFILAIDVLYLLDAIEFDHERGILSNVERTELR
jgi:hypothetical protein